MYVSSAPKLLAPFMQKEIQLHTRAGLFVWVF